MLQQTQVKTVVPYFKNFIKKFPSQKRLAGASEDQVLAAWSGLGFYRRARNIFATKEIIKNNYGNRFPNQFQQIIELPGIGKSTAGAIMSLAYLDPHPILDGNVKRVISRFLKKELELMKEAELWALSKQMINTDDCFSYTQGIMEQRFAHHQTLLAVNVRSILNACLLLTLKLLKEIKLFQKKK